MSLDTNNKDLTHLSLIARRRDLAMRRIMWAITAFLITAVCAPVVCTDAKGSARLCKIRVNGDAIFLILQDSEAQIVKYRVFLRNPNGLSYKLESWEIPFVDSAGVCKTVTLRIAESMRQTEAHFRLFVSGDNIASLQIVKLCDSADTAIVALPGCCDISEDKGEMADLLNSLDREENKGFNEAGRTGTSKNQVITDSAAIVLALNEALVEMAYVHEAVAQVTKGTARYQNAKKQVDKM
jgi:hypothetical protein